MAISKEFRNCFVELVDELELDNKTEIAKKLDLTYSTFLKIYNYGILPSIPVLVRIADFFKVSLDYLLGYSDLDRFIPASDYTPYTPPRGVNNPLAIARDGDCGEEDTIPPSACGRHLPLHKGGLESAPSPTVALHKGGLESEDTADDLHKGGLESEDTADDLHNGERTTNSTLTRLAPLAQSTLPLFTEEGEGVKSSSALCPPCAKEGSREDCHLNSSTFYSRLNELRIQRGIPSIYELAKISHIHRNNFAQWFKKGYLPAVDDLVTLASVFNVSLDYLLARTDEFNSFASRSPHSKEQKEESPPNDSDPQSDLTAPPALSAGGVFYAVTILPAHFVRFPPLHKEGFIWCNPHPSCACGAIHPPLSAKGEGFQFGVRAEPFLIVAFPNGKAFGEGGAPSR